MIEERRKKEQCKVCHSTAKLRFRDKEGAIVLDCLICGNNFSAGRDDDKVEFHKWADKFNE